MTLEVHEKVWGRELWIVNNELYCGKILEVRQGWQCSLHYHKLKDETFYVLEGTVLWECGDDDPTVITKGAVVHIVPGTLHRFSGVTNVQIMEISTQHFEDDSYRIEPSGHWDPTLIPDKRR